MEPLNDEELNRLLKKWEAPPAPASLRRRVFSHEPRGWRRLWAGSFRIPVPVAVATVGLAALWLFYSGLRETPPVLPVVEPTATTLAGFQPVPRLEPIPYSGGQK